MQEWPGNKDESPEDVNPEGSGAEKDPEKILALEGSKKEFVALAKSLAEDGAVSHGYKNQFYRLLDGRLLKAVSYVAETQEAGKKSSAELEIGKLMSKVASQAKILIYHNDAGVLETEEFKIDSRGNFNREFDRMEKRPKRMKNVSTQEFDTMTQRARSAAALEAELGMNKVTEAEAQKVNEILHKLYPIKQDRRITKAEFVKAIKVKKK